MCGRIITRGLCSTGREGVLARSLSASQLTVGGTWVVLVHDVLGCVHDDLGCFSLCVTYMTLSRDAETLATWVVLCASDVT